MKTLKLVTIIMLLTMGSGLQGCKKYVKKDDVKKIETIDRTIQPYEWNWNSLYKRWEYAISHEYLYDDAVVGYIIEGGQQALPFYNAEDGVIYGLVDNTIEDKIIVTYYDGGITLDHPNYPTYIYVKIIPSME